MTDTIDNVTPLPGIKARFTGGQQEKRDRTIEVRPDALHLIATEACEALVHAEAPLFVRSGGGGIVRPVTDEVAASRGRRTKVARLCEMSSDNLTDYLSRAAHWVKFNVRKNELVPTDPPSTVAKTILGRDGEWPFPVIAGVITTPTLRPDGSILSREGYDPQTRLLLISPPTLPPIPDKPTQGDAEAALKILDELLDNFPFVDAASRSVALSAMITPVVRGAVQAAPLHAFKAPTPGTGKSYAVDIASCITTGEPAPVIAAAPKEEETEKRLVAALIGGQSIIAIDNVNGALGGDLLCQMIERPIVTPRILGASKLIKIENRATCFATGNNIQLVGDMTRRVLVSSLDANLERPELRRFDFSPTEAVVAHRGRYIAAALTICRAYAVAGFPGQLLALASFEDWSRIVRSALVWLGREDPVKTMEQARADDPGTAAMRAVFNCWHSAVGDNWVTAAALIETAKRQASGDGFVLLHPDLNAALLEVAENNRHELDTRRLSKYLSRNKGRILDDLKLLDSDDLHAKVKLWKIQRQEDA